jgi:hypothetical protein
MNEDISVPTDRGSKVGVERHGQTVMEEVRGVAVGRTEVQSLVHTPGSHDPHEFVELGVVWLDSFVQTFCESFGGVNCYVEPKIAQKLNKIVNFLLFGRRMASQDGKRREMRDCFFSNCAVSQEHELFNHEMGVDMFVLSDSSGFIVI